MQQTEISLDLKTNVFDLGQQYVNALLVSTSFLFGMKVYGVSERFNTFKSKYYISALHSSNSSTKLMAKYFLSLQFVSFTKLDKYIKQHTIRISFKETIYPDVQ